jgi:hypothetical protein
MVTSVEIEALLQILANTPRHLATVSRGLSDARLQLKPDADSWSANEILAHLRACADVWGQSIQTMLDQDHPALRYISPRAWIRKTDYPQLAFQPSLQAFTRQRKALLNSALAPGVYQTAQGTAEHLEAAACERLVARREDCRSRAHGRQLRAAHGTARERAQRANRGPVESVTQSAFLCLRVFVFS